MMSIALYIYLACVLLIVTDLAAKDSRQQADNLRAFGLLIFASCVFLAYVWIRLKS